MPKKVLWIAPNLNHYKIRFLNYLADQGNIQIEVLSGLGTREDGHTQGNEHTRFTTIEVPVSKKKFAFRLRTHRTMVSQLRKTDYDYVLVPIEKKNLPLILTLLVMRIFRRFKLVSYNHLVMRSKGGRTTIFDKLFARFCFRRFDRVVFYTEGSRNEAVSKRLLPDHRAYFANNTLDTNEIWNQFSFAVNSKTPVKVLFIGRLVEKKKLEILFEYFAELKKTLRDVELHIVGDGPMHAMVQTKIDADPSAFWYGAIHDEPSIRAIMEQCHFVFVPGHTGLSIVHAFCYGKPFVTLGARIIAQPPEIEYLQDGINGIQLSGNKVADVKNLADLMGDADRYRNMCQAAFDTALHLKIENWSSQFESALLN